MKLSTWQSILAILALCIVVTLIMVAGFLWRPVWPGSSPAATSSAPEISAPPITDEQRAQNTNCISNQIRINALVVSYVATEEKDPPTGVIDGNHPLVVNGYLEQPLSCPVTGDYYVLYGSPGDEPPRTRCPTEIESHHLPDE